MIDFKWKNEKASDYGIIVSSLPPISKAMQRTETIEIDGRDGDIIIEKGFKAYDKQVQIGLARNYDLNFLNNWLNGSGHVIFSNEEEYFYIATVIGQVDFKRLLSFKIATITFHVQPFKYLVNETKFDKTFTSSDSKKIEVVNTGLMDSKPIFTIKGNGIVDLSINGKQYFVIDFDEFNDDPNDYEEITIDSIQEEAYEGNILTLRNRCMNGIFPILQSGKNEITWTGDVQRIQIDPKSRWL